MIQETKDLLEKIKAKNMASDRQCKKCGWYIKRYKDENGIRPACGEGQRFGYVSHNPASSCIHYEEKNER